jgi:hypothetical protein
MHFHTRNYLISVKINDIPVTETMKLFQLTVSPPENVEKFEKRWILCVDISTSMD